MCYCVSWVCVQYLVINPRLLCAHDVILLPVSAAWPDIVLAYFDQITVQLMSQKSPSVHCSVYFCQDKVEHSSKPKHVASLSNAPLFHIDTTGNTVGSRLIIF